MLYRAIFVPPQKTLWDVRQAVRERIYQGAEPAPFILACREYFRPGQLEARMADFEGLTRPLRDAASGSLDGRLRCALIADADTQEGIIIHFERGAPVVTAYPLMDKALILRERQLIGQLRALRRQGADVRVSLSDSIPQGVYHMDQLIVRLLETLTD